MSFSTEQVVFHDQRKCDRPDPRIAAWFNLNQIKFGPDIRNHKYAKIGFTGGRTKDLIIITFHMKKVKGSIEL